MTVYDDILNERWPGRAFRSNGFVQVTLDALELGARVAYFLDSENNAPEYHFMDWPAPYEDDPSCGHPPSTNPAHCVRTNCPNYLRPT